MTYSVGLDVSLDETAICIVDAAGKMVREGKAATEPEAILIWFQKGGLGLPRLDRGNPTSGDTSAEEHKNIINHHMSSR